MPKAHVAKGSAAGRDAGIVSRSKQPKRLSAMKGWLASRFERRLDAVRDLLSQPAVNRAQRDQALRAALGKAHEIACRYRSRSGHDAVLEAAYRRHGIRPARPGSNPYTRPVKLCFPGRRASDYNRYAAVLRLAEREGWSPEELERVLAETPNALATLAARDARLANPRPPAAPPSLFERGCALVRRAETLGSFKISGKTSGLVLLLGEVDGRGRGVVRRLVRGQEDVLRRLIVAAARE